MKLSAVQNTAVQSSAVQYSEVQYVVFLQLHLHLPEVVPREGGQRGGERGGRLAHCAPGTLPGVAGNVHKVVQAGKLKHCLGCGSISFVVQTSQRI